MPTRCRVLLGVQRPPARSYALDLEYVKFNGSSYVRSLALVPFARVGMASRPLSHTSKIVTCAGCPDSSRVQWPSHRLTDLGSTPTVLELNPREVMRLAEPLPCGHLLLPKIQEAFVQGISLKELLAPFEAETRSAINSLSFLRLALRKRGGNGTRSATGDPACTSLRVREPSADDVDTDADLEIEANAFPGMEGEGAVWIPVAYSSAEAEKLAVRELHIQLGIARFFKGLDPFGIPNIHRFDRQALELLYAAPVDSRDFVEASKHICGLRAYSKGRQGYKPLASLSRHHPRLLQALLHRSFESADTWYKWLADCAACVEEDLIRVRNAHRDGTHVNAWRSPVNSTGGVEMSADRIEASSALLTTHSFLHFNESSTMEDLATQLQLLWRRLEETSQGCHNNGNQDAPPCSRAKVYVYGSSDAPVLHRTMRLAFTGTSPMCHTPERGNRADSRYTGPNRHPAAAAKANATKLTSSHPTSLSLNGPLLSPIEAVVVDATRHPLFTAAGFAASPKQPPSLMAAVEKAAGSDATAAALFSAPQWHDPLWDAQALACVCASAGITRTTEEKQGIGSVNHGLTRRVAGGRAKQRLPRSLQGLSTPNMRRSWWDMKNLSSAEKRELLCGSWRAANPIRLVPGPSSRVSCSESEPLTFATEEAADHYMAEEDKDVASETHESTLALAERFFVELASAADGEVDGAQMPQDPQSDDERRREMRDVQREFFGDFYVEQGIVDESSRYAFVDTMLRPSRPLFLVNAVLPLARLTVRDQLESHCAVSPNLDGGPPSATSTGVAGVPLLLPVFTPTLFNPCLYAIPLPPTQTFGAPLHVSFSAASSRLNHVKHHDEDPSQGVDGSASSALVLEEAPNSAGEQKLLSSSGTSVDLVADADELRAMMLDALPCSEADSLPSPTAGQSASMRDPGREAGVTGDNTAVSAPAVSAVAPNPATKPPSLAHMYWLQRQVASDTLLNVDDVSVVVSLLSVRLAAFSMARGGASQPYEVILCQANDRDATACAYHTEIAQYLFQAAQEESSDPAATDRLARVVIAVEDVTLNGRPAASPHSLKENRDGSRRQRRPTHQTPLPCTESAVPVMDRYPNMVYLQPPLPRVRGRPGAPLRGDLDSRSAPAAAHIPSRVVLCMPATSRDGVRPRGWLAGTEHEAVDEDADLSPFAADDAWCPRRGALSVLSGAPPNTFVERCRMANANFSKLREQLYDAIHTVRVDGCGWVIYATQSANVIENEAVVCAVLQRIREEGDIRQPPLPRDSSAAADGDKIDDSAGVSKQVESTLSVECVPLDSPTIEACMASPEAASVLRLLCSEGRRGLSTWVAIKDGAAGQEAEQISAELRASVARAAWRTDPMRSGSDGGFVVCLRVARPRAFLRHQHGGIGETVARGPPRLCRWWTHPRSRVVSAVTPAALRFITDAERGDAAGQGHASKGASRILHAGVPVGYVPTLPEVSATGSDDVPSAPGLPVDCRISSAICHVDALGALRRSLPPLALPAKALCELLLVRHIDSRVLRRQLRLCQKQSTIQRRRELDVEGCATDVEAETRAFLGAVERVAEAHLASTLSSAKLPSRFYAWVGVVADSLLPSGEICFDPQATESSEAPAATGSAALDSAVLTEVKAAGVVVEVECSRYPSSCDSSSSHMEFSVRLDVPPDMPERFKHLAALEEWRVALRDALLYVRRRTTKESSPFRLWADQSINHTRVPAPRFAAGRASGAMSVPRSGELVELAEDEYESLHTTRMVPTLGAASLPPVRDTPCNV